MPSGGRIRTRPFTTPPSCTRIVCVATSPVTIAVACSSTRSVAWMLPVIDPPITTSRAYTSPLIVAPTPTTTVSARRIVPSSFPSIRSDPAVSRSPIMTSCASSSEYPLLVGPGGVAGPEHRGGGVLFGSGWGGGGAGRGGGPRGGWFLQGPTKPDKGHALWGGGRRST